MTRLVRASFTALFASVIASAATGEVTTELIASDYVTPTTLTRTDPFTVDEHSVISGGSSASVFGSLSAGTLRATAYSDEGFYSFAYASAVIQDRLTFTSGFGGTVKLWWGLSSDISADNGISNTGVSYAQASVEVFSPSLSIIGGYRLQNGVAACSLPCETYTDGITAVFQRYGVIPWEITPDPVSVQLQLSVLAAGNGEWVNAKNTGRFFLELPPGATFSSQSGAFLVEAVPLPAVPEVGSAAMLVLGLLGLAARMKRQTMT